MNNKTTPKDFFLHLGATIALYAAAVALINLAFSIINYAYPDTLAGSFYADSIAWPISMLVILVPLLYLLEWLINRDIARMPEKKDLWIRKWRINLTLFLAIVLVGGDLITLINTYLNGEITVRFVYKVLAIILVAGTVGKYYFFSLYENFKWASLVRRINMWFALVLVVAAIVGGFIIVGSPTKQRSIRFDSQRVGDLSNIQYQVINAWQRKGKLPETLAELKDPTVGSYIPVDPETSKAYGYSVKGEMKFELCADFALSTQDIAGRGAYGGRGGVSPMETISSYPYLGGGDDAWDHKSGTVCFERTIDPTRYQPYKQEPRE